MLIKCEEKLNVPSIIAFLEKMDMEFPECISSKCLISDYVKKLVDVGNVFCVSDNDAIIGLIGGYANDDIFKEGYISILVLNPEYRGRRISKILLRDFINYAKKSGMHFLKVNTYYTNIEARGLYESFGFILDNIENKLCFYSKDLKEDS